MNNKDAQIAALRAAMEEFSQEPYGEEWSYCTACAKRDGKHTKDCEVAKLLSDTAAAAQAHDAAIRRAALKDAADYIRGLCGPEMDSVADEIETFDEEGGDHE